MSAVSASLPSTQSTVVSTNRDTKTSAEDQTKAIIVASKDQLIASLGSFESGMLIRKGGKIPAMRRGGQDLKTSSPYFWGIAYFYGIGVQRTYDWQANRYFKEDGGPDSLYHLGLCSVYQEKRDLKEACDYFKRAMEAGHLDAMVEYAMCLENGFGTEQKPVQAYEIYLIAAEAGQPQAQYVIATFFLNKKESDSSKKRISNELAVFWLEKAAAQHLTAAQWLLGKCYEEGKGVPKDDNKAVQLYQTASLRVEKLAVSAYGKKPLSFGTQADIQWLAKAQEGGDARARFELALRYRKGTNLSKDIQQAILRFQTLAKANLSDVSRHHSGWYYDRKADLAQIISCEVRAMEQLGFCYQETWEEEGLPGVAQGLIPFYFIQEVKRRQEQLDRQKKTHLMSEAERVAGSMGKFEFPFYNPKFQQFLEFLKTCHGTGTTQHIIEMEGENSLVITDSQNFPSETVVLLHRGTGNIVIDVTDFTCANLFIICENGNLEINPNSIFNVKGEMFCLAAGIAGSTIQIQDALINVGHAFVCMATTSIDVTTKTMGDITAKLGVFFSPNTQLNLHRKGHILNCFASAIPSMVEEHLKKTSHENSLVTRFKTPTPNEVKEYLDKMIDIMHSYLKPGVGMAAKPSVVDEKAVTLLHSFTPITTGAAIAAAAAPPAIIRPVVPITSALLTK